MHKKLCTYWLLTYEVRVYIPVLCLSMICDVSGQTFQARTYFWVGFRYATMRALFETLTLTLLK